MTNWTNNINGHAIYSDRLAPACYRDLELIKEENALKDNTYTVSYKQKVNDEWVLVTKTGRSDSKETKGIMRDLTAGEIPEEHLELLMWSVDVSRETGNLLEGWRGNNEQ